MDNLVTQAVINEVFLPNGEIRPEYAEDYDKENIDQLLITITDVINGFVAFIESKDLTIV